MSWWFTALRGAVALALGVAVLVASLGQSSLTTFLAVYFLLAGVAALRSASAGSPGRRARLRRGAGIVAIVVAVGILGRELSEQYGPDWVITTVLGIGSIAVGSMRLAGAFVDEEDLPARARRRLPGSEIALGSAELILGVTLLTADFDLIWPAVGLWGIVGGTALLRDAQRRRRRVTHATQPRGV